MNSAVDAGSPARSREGPFGTVGSSLAPSWTSALAQATVDRTIATVSNTMSPIVAAPTTMAFTAPATTTVSSTSGERGTAAALGAIGVTSPGATAGPRTDGRSRGR